MAQTFPYADASQTATAVGEIIARYRAGTVDDDLALLVNQAHGAIGFGCKLTFGDPGAPVTPIGPVIRSGADPSFDEACKRIETVAKSGMPKTGPTSWITAAIRVALVKVIQNSKLPDGIKAEIIALIEKVL